MKILLLTTSLEIGGAEKQVCELADRFVENGHQVRIVSLTGKTLLRPYNESIEILELNSSKTILGLVRALYLCIKWIREFRPDIFHSHMVHANIFSRIIKVFFISTPLICTAHSINEGGRARTLAYRYTDFLSDLNTNVSQEAVELYIKKGICKSHKIRSVCNGIDINRFKFSPVYRDNKRKQIELDNNEILLLAVGRLTEAKDYPNLINAFEYLTNSSPIKVRLVIIGDGELKNSLIDLVYQKKLEDSVLFLGAISDVDKWMSAADIFVMSSEWEGLPLVLLEAMSSERFVVATDCGGIKKLIENNGEVVPIKDSYQLFEALLKCVNMSDNQRSMVGESARERIINNFSSCAISEQWISIYREQIEAKA
ncbi:glycosyltransferase [Vibrio vulnificus]|uniref:glycosyltransferase n=1 Tax=Vibrio vulnificus TaxID=672 RepID=UPI0024E03063|nr:glycosyltransferase [Vibrio vulnificus]MDK2687744.1 glycosyltransferase [Vibrio vulnificus]